MSITSFAGKAITDSRGSVLFFNDVDLSEVVRLYEIFPKPDHPRGWQAHKLEKKWFYCKSGTLLVNLVKLDNFEHPSATLKPELHMISSKEPEILAVPGGYATAFKAIAPNTNLMVFSNFTLEASQKDDYRYNINHWQPIWQ